jgi:hypothetical protein
MKEKTMKAILCTVILIAVFVTSSCSKKDNSQYPTENQTGKSYPSYVEGEVSATFSDTVSKSHAESFLQSHNLSTYTLYDFDQAPPHTGQIKVEVGQEYAWIDTLQKYPEIKHAQLIYIWYSF